MPLSMLALLPVKLPFTFQAIFNAGNVLLLGSYDRALCL